LSRRRRSRPPQEDLRLSYFRHRYCTFEEFQREAFVELPSLGKEELELLADLEEDDDAYHRPRRRRSVWD
jgi:hypothetical protein